MGGVELERPLGVGFTPVYAEPSGETAGYAEYVRWCGRGTGATPPPIPISNALLYRM